jgi:AcrR family transcriptional regulator
MAKKAGTGRKSAKRPATSSEKTFEGAVFTAALGLAAERGWGKISLADIAEAAQTPMSELHARFATKQAILDAFSRHVDHAVLKTVDDEAPEGNARERLFDVLMRRFDVLDADRDGVKAVVKASACDPLALACGACGLRRSMAAMLEAAGISAGGLAGILRVKGLAAVYLAALRAWLGDDSPDRAKTMAALDRALRRADGWAAMLDRLRPSAPKPQPA